MTRFAFAMILCSAIALPAAAAPVSIDLPEPQFTLKDAPGRDVVMNNCQTCHALDYVLTQPPKIGEKFWDAEVTKMIKTFGAPVKADDAATIAAYLKANYN